MKSFSYLPCHMHDALHTYKSYNHDFQSMIYILGCYCYIMDCMVYGLIVPPTEEHFTLTLPSIFWQEKLVNVMSS